MANAFARSVETGVRAPLGAAAVWYRGGWRPVSVARTPRLQATRRELTAQQAIDRIRARVGVPWRETTVDTFKAGDPATVVTGIATTVMATLPVLRQAAAAGRNLIVTCEPTFYSGNDDPGPRATDPVYLAKKAFIDEHRLVVWRFSDHWGARVPNEFASALADTLGWAKLRTPDEPADLRRALDDAGRAGGAHARAAGRQRRHARHRKRRHADPAGRCSVRERRLFKRPSTTCRRPTSS